MRHEELNANRIKQAIHGQIKPEIECLGYIDSTNDEMKRRAAYGVPDSALLVAEEQSNGRGRLQRTWISPKYQNIYATFLWRRSFQLSDIVRVSMMSAVAVCDVLRKEYHCDAWIKWPNDILIEHKKCAGILCEAQTKLNFIEFILVGIGLNVNMDDMPEGIEQSATSIFRVTGKKEDRNKMIAAIYNALYALLDYYQKTKQFLSIWEMYQSMSLVLQKSVKIIDNNQIYEGIVESIDEEGILILRMKNKEKKLFLNGEVSLRMQNSQDK